MRTFDRFADWVAEVAASAYFFGFCVGLVSQLVINTATTIITFLLVALLHNSTHRFEQAVNLRLQTLLEHHPTAEDVVADPGQVAEAQPG